MATSISKNLNLAKSSNSMPVWGRPFSPLAYKVQLTASTDQTLLVPSGVDVAIIDYSAGPSVVVLIGAVGDTNALPAPGAFVQAISMANPSVVKVNAGQYLHFISPNPDYVVVNFYNTEELQ